MPVPDAVRTVLSWLVLAAVGVAVSLATLRLLDDGPVGSSGGGRPAPSRAADPEQVAVAVLRAWDGQRAAAYSDGDVAALRRLYAPGSRAGESDVRLLRSYVRRGLRVDGMRQQLLAVELLDAAPHRLTVRVRDRLAAATAVAVDERMALPSDRPSAHRVVLVRQQERWLVWSVDG